MHSFIRFARCTLLGATAASLAPVFGQVSPEKHDYPVVLDTFTVQSSNDRGYRKANSVTTSRIAIPINELPQNVQVISGEMLSDLNVTRADDVFRYSASVTATQNETGQGNLFVMRGFEMPRYTNGMLQANSNAIYGEFVTDNLDRVEVAKGAVGLFYGNSSPNGVANYITKKPQFINRVDLALSGGSFNYAKAVLDIQGVAGADKSLGYRIISSATMREARVNHLKSEALFVAPSFTYQPTKWFRLDAEYNGTKFAKPYGSLNTLNSMHNPEYFADVANPSQAILNYMKTTYGAADDTAARALVQQRWATGRWATYLNRWAADKFAITGTEPFLQAGSTANWALLSPEGDKFNGASPDSNQDGFSHLADVSATFTPLDGLAFKYRWVHQETKQNFERLLYVPNGAPVNGHYTMQALGASLTGDNKRQGFSDTQQIDASYEFNLGSIKNTINGGVEFRRIRSQFGGAPANSTLVNSAAYTDWDPFITAAAPALVPLYAGATPITTRFLFEYRDYYLSHRAQALDGRLNTMVGFRNVRERDANLHDDSSTLSYGAIYEVAKGLSVFASASNTFVFSTTFNIQGQGVTAADNAHLLDPEDGESWEAGLKADLKDGELTGTVSVFQVTRDGIVTADFDANATAPRNLDTNPNNDVRYSRNGGLQRSEGADFDLIWSPNKNFQAVFNYVYLWEAKVISDPSVNKNLRTRIYQKQFERRLTKSPEHQASIVGKYNFTDGNLKGLAVGGAVRYSSEYSPNATTSYDLVVPSETLVDLFATYSGMKVMGNPLDLQLNVSNLADKYNDLTRGNGREISGSIRLRF